MYVFRDAPTIEKPFGKAGFPPPSVKEFGYVFTAVPATVGLIDEIAPELCPAIRVKIRLFAE